jgi:replicative superfamily II helicase
MTTDRHINLISAPMKALASEIVRKLGKRLQWLGIQVRELTGAFDIYQHSEMCL